MLLWQSIAFVFDTQPLENMSQWRKLTNLGRNLYRKKKNKFGTLRAIKQEDEELNLIWTRQHTAVKRSTVNQVKVRNLLALYDKSFSSILCHLLILTLYSVHIIMKQWFS